MTTESCPLVSAYLRSFDEVNEATVSLLLGVMWVRLSPSLIKQLVQEYHSSFTQKLGRSFADFLKMNDQKSPPPRGEDLMIALHQEIVHFWVDHLFDPAVAHSSSLWDNICSIDFPDYAQVFYQAALREGLIPANTTPAGFAQWIYQYQTEDDTVIEWTRPFFSF